MTNEIPKIGTIAKCELLYPDGKKEIITMRVISTIAAGLYPKVTSDGRCWAYYEPMIDAWLGIRPEIKVVKWEELK